MGKLGIGAEPTIKRVLALSDLGIEHQELDELPGWTSETDWPERRYSPFQTRPRATRSSLSPKTEAERLSVDSSPAPCVTPIRRGPSTDWVSREEFDQLKKTMESIRNNSTTQREWLHALDSDVSELRFRSPESPQEKRVEATSSLLDAASSTVKTLRLELDRTSRENSELREELKSSLKLREQAIETYHQEATKAKALEEQVFRLQAELEQFNQSACDLKPTPSQTRKRGIEDVEGGPTEEDQAKRRTV